MPAFRLYTVSQIETNCFDIDILKAAHLCPVTVEAPAALQGLHGQQLHPCIHTFVYKWNEVINHTGAFAFTAEVDRHILLCTCTSVRVVLEYKFEVLVLVLEA